MKTGLFIGRFQPFHNAHLKDVKDAVKDVDILYIGMGSSNRQRTPENPFSTQERKGMIGAALREEGIAAFRIISIPDFDDDDRWMDSIKKTMPRPDIVFMGNEEAQKFFESRGYRVKKLPFAAGISATLVRERMRANEDWESLVPEAVVAYIKKANLLRHIR